MSHSNEFLIDFSSLVNSKGELHVSEFASCTTRERPSFFKIKLGEVETEVPVFATDDYDVFKKRVLNKLRN